MTIVFTFGIFTHRLACRATPYVTLHTDTDDINLYQFDHHWYTSHLSPQTDNSLHQMLYIDGIYVSIPSSGEAQTNDKRFCFLSRASIVPVIYSTRNYSQCLSNWSISFSFCGIIHLRNLYPRLHLKDFAPKPTVCIGRGAASLWCGISVRQYCTIHV